MRRREAIGAALAAAVPGPAATGLRASTFRADITPPLGHSVLSGVPVRSIVDPLWAHGLVLSGAPGEKPVVLAALDWCEIRNAAYDRWREALGRAAGTTRERVLLSCVHQHDAPYVDTGAQRLIEEHRVPGRLCDPKFNEEAMTRVAAALRASLRLAKPVTHLGSGQAKVESVASNRRYVLPDGKISFGRTSATRDPAVRNMPEGLIDPWLKTLSFWNQDEPVAAVSCYSTHPMSYYGKGDVSADFPGLARSRRQAETPGVAQIFLSGCAGDTMAGRYNDGDPANRPVLAARLHAAMVEAWKATERRPLTQWRFRNAELRLKPRATKGFSAAELKATLADASQPYRLRSEAALGLSWLARSAQPIDLPAVEFNGPAANPAHLVLLPAEAFVQYQLWAQQERPDSFVVATGYGECAPGYIPTAESAAEGYDDHYSWIAFPECEPAIRQALRRAMARK